MSKLLPQRRIWLCLIGIRSNARKQAEKLDIEVRWDVLAEQILQEIHRGYGDETSGEPAGCYIFGSYAKSDPKEAKFIKRNA